MDRRMGTCPAHPTWNRGRLVRLVLGLCLWWMIHLAARKTLGGESCGYYTCLLARSAKRVSNGGYVIWLMAAVFVLKLLMWSEMHGMIFDKRVSEPKFWER